MSHPSSIYGYIVHGRSYSSGFNGQSQFESLPARHREVAFRSVELNGYVCHVGQTPGGGEKAVGSGRMVGPVA